MTAMDMIALLPFVIIVLIAAYIIGTALREAWLLEQRSLDAWTAERIEFEEWQREREGRR